MPGAGTALFALLALAGDVGGTLGPSLVGLCTRKASSALQGGLESGLQGGLESGLQGGPLIQSGLLAASVFPLLLVASLLLIRRRK